MTPGGAISLLADVGATCNHIDIDAAGNLYVASAVGGGGGNGVVVHKITPAGVVSSVLDAANTPISFLLFDARSVAVDDSGNVFALVSSPDGDAVVKVTPGGTATVVLDSSGDGQGNGWGYPLAGPISESLDTDSDGNVYANSSNSNVFRVTPTGTVDRILGPSGDAAGNTLSAPTAVHVGGGGALYVTGYGSNNAFKFSFPGFCVPRNGSGVNPMDYACVTNPTVGFTWTSAIDTTPSQGVFTAATAIRGGLGGATSGFFDALGQEFLVLPAFVHLISTGPSMGLHAFLVPNDPLLVGLGLSTQGVRLELTADFEPITVLLNGVDITIVN